MIPLSMPCLPSQHVDRGAPAQRNRAVRGITGLLLGLLALPAMAQVSLTTLDVAYTQDFNSLPNSGAGNSWTNNPAGPNPMLGWHAIREIPADTEVAVATIDAGAGGSNSGQLYSFGTGAATDRALGTVGSNTSGHFYYGVRLKNDTGATITSLDISYFGEQWRNGGNTTSHTATFSYVTRTAPYTGSLAEFKALGTSVADLNFTGPIATASTAAVDGNVAGRSPVALSDTLEGLNVLPGDEIFLRWSDLNQSGNDHGLAIDDISITPHGSTPLPALSVDNVSHDEGNAGPTIYTFTVSLSAPAPVGGVTFDIDTADDSAESGTDYVAFSDTVTILENADTATFDVTVNGDTTLEADENFLVNISGITGASNTTASATGTIANDDAGAVLGITDASVAEGSGGGTTPLTFTVTLSEPAPIGGVGFTINTDDIAVGAGFALAGNDYTAQVDVDHTIPAGDDEYQFSVLVAADTNFEPNETFNVILSDVTNAVGGATVTGTITNDDVEPATPIHDVQGNGAATPIPGATVTIEGVVIGDYQTQGTGQLRGFFVQEETTDEDADPNTSEGIFVFCSSCPTAVAEGQVVRVTGAVSEFNGSTQITASSAPSVTITNAGNNLAQVTPATIDLPIIGDVNAYHEARESMLVTYSDTLKVSEYFQLARYGTITLFAGDRPRQFTADNAPSVPGLTAHLAELATRRVILDDTDNGDNGVLNLPDGFEAIFHPQANGGFGVGTQGTDFFRGGDEVANLTGVLHWSFAGTGSVDAWRIRPTAAAPVTFTAANQRPATAPVVGGAIKAAGANVLNYFSTVDAGPNICGPGANQDCRGADSTAELIRQRERTSIVLCGLDADVTGLIEIENHASGAALLDLIAAVNARCGDGHDYALAGSPNAVGTDAIRVALIYRTGVLAPVGGLQTDTDSIHDRPPNAQTFDVVDATNPAFGERFTAVVNHFKSKGSCPGPGVDADQGDGQGCWASKRTQQAERLTSWIESTVITAAGDPDVLVLGDLNSNAAEDPIVALEDAGYTDLMLLVDGDEAYSYLFDGQLGHLDYALASDTLLGQVAGMAPWHINADEAPVLDYNDTVLDSPGEANTFDRKPDGSALVPPRLLFQPETPYRGADHDPVLVGLFPIINADVGIAIADAPDPVTAGTQLVYTVTVDNAGPDTAEDVEWSGTLPTDTTFVSLSPDAGCVVPAVGETGDVSCSIASLPVGDAQFTLTVAVDEAVAQGTVLDFTVAVVSGSVDGNDLNDDATAGTTVNEAPEGLLAIDPASVDFGDAIVGDTSSTVFVTLSNDGDATLEITALTTATSPFARAGGTCSEMLPIAIAAGDDCTIGYTFTPTVTGAANLDVSVTADVPGSGVIALSGNGLPVPQGLLVVAPASLDFGDVVEGDTSATMFVTVSNDGDATLTVSPDAAATPFARVDGTCSTNASFNLAAGDDCTIGYAFSPFEEGTPDQTITFATTAPVSGTGTVVLSGVGLPGPEGHLVISPSEVPFGDVGVGDTSATLFVNFTNDGDASLSIDALGTANAPFARADGGNCPSDLPIVLGVGQSCTIGYTFSPTVTGPANQQIIVSAPTKSAHTKGTNGFTLSGNGVLEADVSVTIDDGREVVGSGETLDYLIVVSNATGPSTATVTVEDVLPATLSDGIWDCIATGVGASCGSGTGDTLTDVATLPAGSFVTYVFSATVQPGSEGLTIENEASATVDVGVDDPNLLNNVATDSNLVENPIFDDGFETID